MPSIVWGRSHPTWGEIKSPKQQQWNRNIRATGQTHNWCIKQLVLYGSFGWVSVAYPRHAASYAQQVCTFLGRCFLVGHANQPGNLMWECPDLSHKSNPVLKGRSTNTWFNTSTLNPRRHDVWYPLELFTYYEISKWHRRTIVVAPRTRPALSARDLLLKRCRGWCLERHHVKTGQNPYPVRVGNLSCDRCRNHPSSARLSDRDVHRVQFLSIGKYKHADQF